MRIYPNKNKNTISSEPVKIEEKKEEVLKQAPALPVKKTLTKSKE